MISLAAFLFLAAAWDVRKRRIPNIIILSGFMAGTIKLFVQPCTYSVLNHFLGGLLPLLICMPLYLMRTLGAGDIKLFSVVGYFLSIQGVLSCLYFSFLFASVYSLIFLFKKKILFRRLSYAVRYLISCLREGRLKEYYPLGREGERIREDTSIPFAPFILLATIITIGGNYL